MLTKKNHTEIPPPHEGTPRKDLTKGLHLRTRRMNPPPNTRWRRCADSSAAAVVSCGFFPFVAHAPISRSRAELPLARRLAAFIVAGIAWQFVSVVIIIISIMVFFQKSLATRSFKPSLILISCSHS